MTEEWKLLTCLWDVPSARVLTDVLESEGITARVVTDAVVMGQAAPCRGVFRFTVTFFRCVKLSSMPSSENSRPMPLCL